MVRQPPKQPKRRRVLLPTRTLTLVRSRQQPRTNTVSRVRRPRFTRFRTSAKRAFQQDAVTEVTSSLATSFRRTPFMIAAIVVAALVLTSTPTEGPMYDLCKDRSNVACKYVVTNFKKACGLLIFSVAIVDLPAAYRLMAAAGVVLWVYLIPEATPLAYVLQAALLHSYFRVRSDGARFLLILIAVFAYFAGYVVFND